MWHEFIFDSLGFGPLCFYDDGENGAPQVLEQVTETAEQAAEQAEEKLKKARKLLDKAKAKVLDPKTTGAEKLAVINFVRENIGDIMEVTDAWMSFEGEFRELEDMATASAPPTETPQVQSSVTPEPGASSAPPQATAASMEDHNPPVEIPVPAQVTPPSPQGTGKQSLLRRVWAGLW